MPKHCQAIPDHNKIDSSSRKNFREDIIRNGSTNKKQTAINRRNNLSQVKMKRIMGRRPVESPKYRYIMERVNSHRRCLRIPIINQIKIMSGDTSRNNLSTLAKMHHHNKTGQTIE